MTYVIRGLDPQPFAALFHADDTELAAALATKRVADADVGYPCRVSLEDAKTGENLVLVHHVSHDVSGPFRMAHAIFVREGAVQPEPWRDEVPPMLSRRMVGLRAFGADGMLRGGALAQPGETDEMIRDLFSAPEVAYLHVHNATLGCFLAAVERDK